MAPLESMRIRRGTPDDSDYCAHIHILARRQMAYLPNFHTASEVCMWMRNTVFVQRDVWIADVDRHIVGFASLGGGVLINLCVHPDHQGRGIGSALLATVKAFAHDGLKLWTFQFNAGAIRFYERHGFRTLRITDGSDNEERVPDQLMKWSPEKRGNHAR